MIFGFNSFTTLTTFLAYYFLSIQNEDVPLNHNPKIVALSAISDALINNEISKATDIWKEITTGENATLKEDYISSIVSQIKREMNSFDSLEEIESYGKSNSIFISLLHFIKTSILLQIKPQSYAKAWEIIQQNNSELILPNNVLFEREMFTMQFILKDKVEKIPFKICRGRERDCETTKSLHKLFQNNSPTVWAFASGRNFLLQNVKYGSHLYIGKGSRNIREIIAWNPKELTNINQAIFRFNPIPNNVESESPVTKLAVGFRWLQPLWNLHIGLDNPGNETSFKKDECENERIVGKTSEPNDFDLEWKVDFVDVKTFRLILVDKVQNEWTLFVQSPNCNLDMNRSQVGISINQSTMMDVAQSHWVLSIL